MYSREEIKALSDKVLNMAKGADGVEVDFNGGERSGTRWANSTITVNLVQLDQQLSVTVRHGEKTGSSSTREFDDAGLKQMMDEASEAAKAARDTPNLQPREGAQNTSRARPRSRDLISDRASAPRGSGEHRDCARSRPRLRLIPKTYQTTATANSAGFRLLPYAERVYLTCARPRQRLGMVRHTGVKDLRLIDRCASARLPRPRVQGQACALDRPHNVILESLRGAVRR